MKINPLKLLKLTHKGFSKLPPISQNWPTIVTQTDQQTLLKITKNIVGTYPQNLIKVI